MNHNTTAREIKLAYQIFAAVRAAEQEAYDELQAVEAAGGDVSELEPAWDALVNVYEDALDKLQDALQRIGVDRETSLRMIVCPQHSARLDDLVSRLVV